MGYIFALCLLSLWKARDSDFIRFHARQAFLLFVAECVAFLFLVILDKTIGKLPFLGLLVVTVCQLAVYLLALFLSVTGLVKALFGEKWPMPFLGHYAQRLPIL